jgi:hypothetical protein
VVVSSSNEAYLTFNFENSFTHPINSISTSYTSTGGSDIGIMKLDFNGNATWFIQDGGVENDIVADIALFENNPNNQIIISGIILNNAPFTSQGTIGLTGNSTSIAGQAFPYHRVGSADSWGLINGTTFTASYTESPTSLFAPKWAEFLDIANSPITSNSSVPTQVHKLEVDATGNIYVLGAAHEDFPFVNKNTTNVNGLPSVAAMDSDHFIISYDNLGTERWAGLYGSTMPDIMSSIGYDLSIPNCPSSMKVDDFGNAYLAIQILNVETSCPTTLPSTSTFNHFGLNLLKINLNNGNLIWSKAIAEPQCTYKNYNNINSFGDHIIGNHTFHPNVEVNSAGDVYVTGNFMLDHYYSNTLDQFTDIDFYSSNGGQSINYTNMDNYYQNTVTGKHLGSFVEKFSSTGNFEWVLTNTSIISNGISVDPFIPSALAIDPSNNIYYSFGFQGEIDINSTTYDGSTGDGYIVRIQDQGTGGVYARQTTNSNTTSNQNTVSTLSNNTIENTTSSISTKLYPNPTTGKVTLEIKSDLENNEVEQIIIYDVTGRKVQEINTEQQETTFDINLNSQQSGVYFVEMMINQELITKRVILMK